VPTEKFVMRVDGGRGAFAPLPTLPTTDRPFRKCPFV
jgi:hypothetical protein